jgi:glycosyltransferase involved in cell wall biosynthesis
MKICFLADASHVNTLNWVNHFANVLKHDTYLISFSKCETIISNVNMIHIKSIFTKYKLKYILSIKKVRNIVKNIKPDLLIGYRPPSYGFLAACTGFHPLVIALQGQHPVYPPDSIVKIIFAKYVFQKADLINSWAEHMSSDLIRFKVNPKKLKTYPRGVIIPENSFIKKRVCNNYFTLISTRGLNPGYNHEQIILSLPSVIKYVGKVRYLIAGDGKEKKKLKTLVHDLGIENHVEFLGNIQYKEIINLLMITDVMISAVPTDGVSSSLLEAMTYGAFPIVTDNIANRLWIEDGKNGILFPLGNIEILANKIIQAYQMPELRENARHINLDIIRERADWNNNMKKMESDYMLLVENYKIKYINAQ